MSFSPLVDQLISSLRCLPGVGPKSAQRMAFYLLERGRHKGTHLAKTLIECMEKIGHCQQCNTFSEVPVCTICQNPRRDPSILCVVETPADLLAIENTRSFAGLYFVLMGHLSPLDGIGPQDLAIETLLLQLRDNQPNEVIIATNPTIEGEATAHYLAEQIKPLKIKTTRFAHGVPMGGELELIDGGTLMRAFAKREVINV